MRTNWIQRLTIGFVLLLLGSVSGDFSRAEDKPAKSDKPDKPDHVINRPTDILISDPNLLRDFKAEMAGKFWIGVSCEPAGAVLHAQLPDLPEGAGLVIQQVIADSPAAKAGIKPNDILFAAGDKPLAQVADLSGAIAAGKDAELSIKLLRGGKSMTVTVKPEEQKPSLKLNELTPDGKALRLWVNQVNPDALNPLVLNDIEIATPDGTKLTPGANKHELPDDMTVDIHREGKKPAKITVKKGHLKWEIDDNQLEKLPEDVRREVEPLLGGGPEQIKLNMTQNPQIPALQLPNELKLNFTVVTGGEADSLNRLQKNVDEIDQRLAEMKRTIGELRAAREKAEKPAK
jgi:membrane-associated protease RseP (regulator of RpoE activity)